ncbi:hypothetical protein MSIMFI_05328 [Mycobacterium simulans]|nr:hypothetical protein MSIMFI_05328 [Mycobacterium simulans]
MNTVVAQGKLGLGETVTQGGQGIDQQGLVTGGSGVDQGDPAGVFVLGAVGQRPHRGVREVWGPVVNAGSHRVTGQDDQMSAQRLGPGQPMLQLRQDVLGQVMHQRQCVVLGRPRQGQRPDHQIGVIQVGMGQIWVCRGLVQAGG